MYIYIVLPIVLSWFCIKVYRPISLNSTNFIAEFGEVEAPNCRGATLIFMAKETARQIFLLSFIKFDISILHFHCVNVTK